MKLIIHRVSKEIGGELISDVTRAIIDLGMPLVNEINELFNIKTLKGKSICELVNTHVLPAVSAVDVARANEGTLIVTELVEFV